MQIKTKILGFLVPALFCPFLTFGQANNPPVRMDIIPPSPNATSLGKFAELPVGLYTGMPNIEIPLWEINTGGLKLPISLSYHAGGVKVEEMASWVGLGWALNAGGVVTRSLMGGADEGGLLFYPMPNPETMNIRFHNDRSYWAAAIKGSADTQPDKFYFNFAGKTGSFYLKNNGSRIEAVLLPYQKIKIEPIIATEISGFKITSEDGVLYEFHAAEEQTSIVQCNGGGGPSFSGYRSSWYLTKVTTPENENIDFEYETYALNYELPNSETRLQNLVMGKNCQDPYMTACRTAMNVTARRLARIVSNQETIEFAAGRNRCDLTGDRMLGAVRIYSNLPSRQLMKEFVLEHSYGRTDVASYLCPPRDSDADRLMLTSVTERNGTERKPPYIFDYDFSRPYPNRLSLAQDHWGYYNGQTLNNTLIPAYEETLSIQGEPAKLHYMAGADRRPDEESARVLMLNKITYPTGGTASFVYELNQCMTGTTSQFVRPKLVDTYVTMTSRTGSALDAGTVIENGAARGLVREFTVNYPGKLDINGRSAVFVHISLGRICQDGLSGEGCGARFEIRDAQNNLVWNNPYGPNAPTGADILLGNGTYKLIHTPLPSLQTRHGQQHQHL